MSDVESCVEYQALVNPSNRRVYTLCAGIGNMRNETPRIVALALHLPTYFICTFNTIASGILHVPDEMVESNRRIIHAYVMYTWSCVDRVHKVWGYVHLMFGICTG